MTNKNNSELLSYNPNLLIDELIERLNLKNDASLARTLNVPREVISKIRHFRRPIGASLLISMHEASGMTIAELRHLMGDRREKFRINYSPFTNDL